MVKLEPLPSAEQIKTIPTTEFYGNHIFYTPQTFHASPLAGTWADDTECYEAHRRNKPVSKDWGADFVAESPTYKQTASIWRDTTLPDDKFLAKKVYEFAPPEPTSKLSPYAQSYAAAPYRQYNGFLPSQKPQYEINNVQDTPMIYTFDPTTMDASEEILTDAIVKFLDDPDVNPYLGSLPSERVVNFARTNHEAIYNSVVGKSPGDWENFVFRHADVLTMFSADRNNKRIRLVKHAGYEMADELMKSFRSEKEARIIACLAAMLSPRPPGNSCTLDHFLEQCINPMMRHHLDEKPHRGDIKRLILKHPKNFIFDKNGFKITRIA